MSLNIVAPRVPDEIWETYRPVILEKYGRLSLKEVMEFMKEEHAFIATCVISPVFISCPPIR